MRHAACYSGHLKRFNWILVCFLAIGTLNGWGAAPRKRPKLLLAVVIDQFRYDYLLRFRNEYTVDWNGYWSKGRSLRMLTIFRRRP